MCHHTDLWLAACDVMLDSYWLGVVRWATAEGRAAAEAEAEDSGVGGRGTGLLPQADRLHHLQGG